MQEVSREEQARLPTESSAKKPRRLKFTVLLGAGINVLTVACFIMAVFIDAQSIRIAQLEQAVNMTVNRQITFNQAVAQWSEQTDSRLNVLEQKK